MVVRVLLLVRKQGIDHWLNLDGENPDRKIDGHIENAPGTN